MTVQTSYVQNLGSAYEGQLYALGEKDVISMSAEGAAGIDFGVAVSRGTDKAGQCTLGGTDFIGVALRSLEREGNASAVAKYSEKETVGVLRRGYVWIKCPAGCNVGDSVKFTSATGVIDAGTAGGGEVQITGATWETVSAAGEIAVLRIA